MTSENVLFIDDIAHFPSFCACTLKEDDPRSVTWIDFWAVEPCSNAEADYVRGQKYADEAISHVRATGQPVFIECVLIFMGIKLRQGNRCAASLEQGFTDRIVRDFPGVMDMVLMRLFEFHPRKGKQAVFAFH